MRTVVALFDQLDHARMAVQDLRDAGIRNDEINLLARDANGEYTRHLGTQSMTTDTEDAGEGAATGAGIGAVLGGLGGLLLGLGALAIPGVGPVIAAGPIVATLAGAGVGAVAGGLVGGLVDLGVPEDHAEYYAEGVRRGGTLVTVRTADEQAETVRDILNRHDPVDIENSVQRWREGNWSGFDEGADPLDYENMEFNRSSTTMPVTGSRIDDEFDNRDFSRQSDIRRTTDLEHDNTELDRETDIYDRQTNMRSVPVTGSDLDERGDLLDDEDMLMDQERDIYDRQSTMSDIPVTGGMSGVQDRDRMGTSMQDTGDINDFDNACRTDYLSRYSTTGRDYEYYQPAYRFGYDMAKEDRYRGYDWNRVEPELRRQWVNRGEQSTWDEVKDAIRHGWESITGRR